MNGPRDFFEQHLPGILHETGGFSLPDGVVVAFHIDGPDGGSWALGGVEEDTQLVPLQDHGRYDCEVTCAAPVFMRILKGSLSAREAFFDGVISVQGDIGLAMRLDSLVPSAA